MSLYCPTSSVSIPLLARKPPTACQDSEVISSTRSRHRYILVFASILGLDPQALVFNEGHFLGKLCRKHLDGYAKRMGAILMEHQPPSCTQNPCNGPETAASSPCSCVFCSQLQQLFLPVDQSQRLKPIHDESESQARSLGVGKQGRGSKGCSCEVTLPGRQKSGPCYIVKLPRQGCPFAIL